MKLIESKAEYIPQEEGLEGIYKMIELAGRTAYHSLDKITPDSAKDFVDRMIKSNHCYDGNTEILTEKGWIKFSEYDEQKVAVINSDLSFKGFEKPSRVIEESYTGKFYKYPTLGIEVTDGHRMFGIFRESKNNFYNNSQYSLFECNCQLYQKVVHKFRFGGGIALNGRFQEHVGCDCAIGGACRAAVALYRP